jgi:IS30 family transposase
MSIHQPMHQILTRDEDKQMARHCDSARATDKRVYFCGPQRPRQRGTCENANGLIRQVLPKGTDLSVYDHVELDSIADVLNNRLRQTLKWRNPIHAFRDFIYRAYEQAKSPIH